MCFHVQNLVKRDKEGYRDEFRQQHRNYLSELEIFKLKVGDMFFLVGIETARRPAITK